MKKVKYPDARVDYWPVAKHYTVDIKKSPKSEWESMVWTYRRKLAYRIMRMILAEGM